MNATDEIRLSARRQIELASSKAPFVLSKVYCDGRPGEVERSQHISCWTVEGAMEEASHLLSVSDVTEAGFANESAVLRELGESGFFSLGDFDLKFEEA